MPRALRRTDQVSNVRKIWCTQCDKNVEAQLTTGATVYPHRADLAKLPFWQCPHCSNHVGCHHKTPNPTRPLGVIANPELKRIRMAIHGVIDPLWKQGQMSRAEIYAALGGTLGRTYHTAEIRTIDEAQAVLKMALSLRDRVSGR